MGVVDHYYIKRAGEKVTGPFSLAKIEDMRRHGRLTKDDQISVDKVHWAAVILDSSMPCESIAPPPEPPPQTDGNVPQADGNMPPWENGAQRNRQAGSPGMPSGAGGGGVGLEPDDASMVAMLFASVWQGAGYFRNLEWKPRAVCLFAQFYTVAVCLVCWLLAPPAARFFIWRWLDIAVAVACSWLALAVTGWSAVMLCCLCGWKRPTLTCTACSAAWLGQVRQTTLLGVLLLFRAVMLGGTGRGILPWCLAGVLFIWNEVNQWRILRDYASKTLGASAFGWIGGAVLSMLIWIEVLFVVIHLLKGVL